MLSEEKIKKMIRLSDYENGLGSTDLKRTCYTKMDYVRLQVIKTVISTTVASVFMALLFVIYHADKFLYQPSMLPWRTYILFFGGFWFVLLLWGSIYTCIRSSRLYAESMERVKEYDETLHDLLGLYEKEEQGQEEKQI